jgi:DNA-binding MarR family transcriptional regulator
VLIRFGRIPISAARDGTLSATDFRVLVALSYHQGTNPCCWPGQRTLARETGLSIPTIRRSMRRLESSGYLITRHIRGLSNVYIVTDPAIALTEEQITIAVSYAASHRQGRRQPQPTTITVHPELL